LSPDQVETIEALDETLVPGANKPAFRTLSISNCRFRMAKPCWKRAFSMSGRLIPISTRRARAVDKASLAKNGGRKFAQLTDDERHGFVDLMRQNKIEGWQGRRGRSLSHHA